MPVPPDSPRVILHLSDLHFGWQDKIPREKSRVWPLSGLIRFWQKIIERWKPAGKTTGGNRDPAGRIDEEKNRDLPLRGLISGLKKLKETEPEWKPTHLFITGDVGWAGKKDDYEQARKWIVELTNLCGLEMEAVFFCPGNHDSNRNSAKKNKRPGNAKEADTALAGPTISSNFEKPFEAFNKFCHDLQLSPYKLAGRENYLCGCRTYNGLRVIGLNSAWFAQDNQDEKQLWVGLPLIRQIDRDGNLPLSEKMEETPATIVLMHHPKEWFNDAEIHAQGSRVNTWDYLGRHCHFLLTGHTHGEVRRVDRVAEAAWHLTGGSAFAGSGHFNNFRLIRLEDNRFSYRAYEFDPRDADQVWSKKLESEPLLFREKDIPQLRLTFELRTPQANDAPSVWLRPESCFVPVVGRDRESQILTEWRESADRFRWRIVFGEGGMGKTRLAQEFALACRGLDWEAGFLELDKLEKLVNHAGFDSWAPRKSTLVIVDYAAGKVEPLKELLKRGLEWVKETVDRPDAPRLRVLLLERSVERDQGWLRELMNLEGVWAQDLASSLALDLELKPPASKGAGVTENIYQIIRSVMNRWSELTGKTAPDFPRPQESDLRRLADNTGGRPLYLQMAALKACFEGKATHLVNWRREELLAAAVERERTYLKRLIEKESKKPGLLEMMERALALLCLTGPWPGDDPGWLKLLSEEATAIGYGQVSAGEVIEGLRTILKSNQEAGENALIPIRPDALASAFTAQLLNSKPNIRPLTLSKVLDLAGLQAWTNLVRMAQDLFGFKQFPVQDWVRPLLDRRPVPELLAWEYQLSGQNPALARWGVEVIQSLIARLSGTPEETNNLARLYNNLGIYLITLGGREEAIVAAKHAAEIYQRLAADNPTAFDPDLAMSLNNLGMHYGALGRREEALVAGKRAVEIYERLAAENPEAFEPVLARSLNNLGNRYSELGRREEALIATKRAVEISEPLATKNPVAFEPDLAMSLSNLGSDYSELGRREEAMTATERAVEIRERLAADNPAAFEPDLAMSLSNLGNRYRELGRREEALTAAKRAVKIYQRLAADNPAAFEPELARSCGVMGSIHQGAGRDREAASSFLAGLRRLAPYFLKLPQAFASLATWLLQSYLAACKSAGIAPDIETVGPIQAKLKEMKSKPDGDEVA